jgi:hypothetical protein
MEVINFIKWQLNKLEFWQKTFLVSIFLMFLSLFFDNPNNFYLIMVGFSIVTFWTLKWFFVDVMIKNYQTYKKEKEALFSMIKESDIK